MKRIPARSVIFENLVSIGILCSVLAPFCRNLSLRNAFRKQKCKGADRDLNYKGNKTAQHLLLDTRAVDLLLCSISDTIRSWQSLCCCWCPKVLMATRKPHQPSVAYSWEHGSNNRFLLIVSFGRHDRSARLGWGFRLVLPIKPKQTLSTF